MNMLTCESFVIDGKNVINTILKKRVDEICATYKVAQSTISLALGMDKSIVNKYIHHADRSLPGIKPFINLCAMFNIRNINDVPSCLGYVINTEADKKLIELQLQSTEYANLLTNIALQLKNSHDIIKNHSTLGRVSSFTLFTGDSAVRQQMRNKVNIWIEMSYDDVVTALKCTHTELSTHINHRDVILIESKGKHTFLVKCKNGSEDDEVRYQN